MAGIEKLLHDLNGGVLGFTSEHEEVRCSLVRRVEMEFGLIMEEGSDFLIQTPEYRWEFEVLDEPPPPLVLQCDEPWAGQIYAPGGTKTFCQAGCLVCCATSLAQWAGYDVDPMGFAEAIGQEGAFAGNDLVDKTAVTARFSRLVWGDDSFKDWRKVAADLGYLVETLEQYPVIVEVDYDPADADVDQHFVVAYRYIPDPAGGLNDDLLVMCPMVGYTSVLDYYNPNWFGEWMEDNHVTRVARTVTGARVWKVV